MKKTTIFILLTALFLGLFAGCFSQGTEPKTDPEPMDYGITLFDQDVYAEPDYASGVVTTVSADTFVTIYDLWQGWYQIDEGWIPTHAVTIIDAPQQIQTTAPEQTAPTTRLEGQWHQFEEAQNGKYLVNSLTFYADGIVYTESFSIDSKNPVKPGTTDVHKFHYTFDGSLLTLTDPSKENDPGKVVPINLVGVRLYWNNSDIPYYSYSFEYMCSQFLSQNPTIDPAIIGSWYTCSYAENLKAGSVNIWYFNADGTGKHEGIYFDPNRPQDVTGSMGTYPFTFTCDGKNLTIAYTFEDPDEAYTMQVRFSGNSIYIGSDTTPYKFGTIYDAFEELQKQVEPEVSIDPAIVGSWYRYWYYADRNEGYVEVWNFGADGYVVDQTYMYTPGGPDSSTPQWTHGYRYTYDGYCVVLTMPESTNHDSDVYSSAVVSGNTLALQEYDVENTYQRGTYQDGLAALKASIGASAPSQPSTYVDPAILGVWYTYGQLSDTLYYITEYGFTENNICWQSSYEYTVGDSGASEMGGNESHFSFDGSTLYTWYGTGSAAANEISATVSGSTLTVGSLTYRKLTMDEVLAAINEHYAQQSTAN